MPQVDICQTTRAYALLECSKLAWGKSKLLDVWVFHRVWSAAYELGWHKPTARYIDVKVGARGLRRKPRIGPCVRQPWDHDQ